MTKSDRKIAYKLWTELEAAGYVVSWATRKGPTTEPYNDYDWLGYIFVFTGPKERFTTTVSKDWLSLIAQGHTWAFGAVSEAIKVNDHLTAEGAASLGVAEEILRTRFVYDLKHDCYNRARRHQVKEQHTHFWDDQRQHWVNLKTLQPEK